MANWVDDLDHSFAGIAEKLNRAKENIFNLNSEISLFFQESDYPVVPENDRELLLKAIEYHQNLAIPLDLQFSLVKSSITCDPALITSCGISLSSL